MTESIFFIQSAQVNNKSQIELKIENEIETNEKKETKKKI